MKPDGQVTSDLFFLTKQGCCLGCVKPVRVGGGDVCMCVCVCVCWGGGLAVGVA